MKGYKADCPESSIQDKPGQTLRGEPRAGACGGEIACNAASHCPSPLAHRSPSCFHGNESLCCSLLLSILQGLLPLAHRPGRNKAVSPSRGQQE